MSGATYSDDLLGDYAVERSNQQLASGLLTDEEWAAYEEHNAQLVAALKTRKAVEKLDREKHAALRKERKQTKNTRLTNVKTTVASYDNAVDRNRALSVEVARLSNAYTKLVISGLDDATTKQLRLDIEKSYAEQSAALAASVTAIEEAKVKRDAAYVEMVTMNKADAIATKKEKLADEQIVINNVAAHCPDLSIIPEFDALNLDFMDRLSADDLMASLLDKMPGMGVLKGLLECGKLLQKSSMSALNNLAGGLTKLTDPSGFATYADKISALNKYTATMPGFNDMAASSISNAAGGNKSKSAWAQFKATSETLVGNIKEIAATVEAAHDDVDEIIVNNGNKLKNIQGLKDTVTLASKKKPKTLLVPDTSRRRVVTKANIDPSTNAKTEAIVNYIEIDMTIFKMNMAVSNKNNDGSIPQLRGDAVTRVVSEAASVTQLNSVASSDQRSIILNPKLTADVRKAAIAKRAFNDGHKIKLDADILEADNLLRANIIQSTIEYRKTNDAYLSNIAQVA